MSLYVREDVEASDEYVLEVDYEPMYHNYVALVERQAKGDEPPPGTGVYDWWQVEADGRIAELAARKCFEGMLVSVQGSLAVQGQEGGPVASSNVLIRPIEIGLVRTSSPESLVGSADAGAVVVVAAAPLLLPACALQKKERQPDFKEKMSGEALWIESKYTPLWAVDNLQLLPVCEVDHVLQKRNPKAPDFKNKQDGNRVVWINDRNTPAWVLPHIDTVLPPPPPPKE
eukprot:gene10118-10276_t